MKSIYAALTVQFFLSNIVFAESRNLYWVSVDLLEMHSEASSASEIKHQLPLHTPLIKLEEKNEWCKVTDINERLSGFVLCNQLITDKQKNMNVFWNNPSVENLLYVARELEKENPEEQINAEIKKISDAYSVWIETHNDNEDHFEVEIQRPANEEFDAMKAILVKGIKVKRDLSLQPVVNEPYFQRLSQFDAKDIYEVGNYLEEIKNKGLLPPIKPSLFLSPQDLLFAAATTSVDDLSVVANSKLTAKTVRSGYGVMGRDEPYVSAYWDIGELEVSLADPIALYAVANNGLVGKKTGKTFGLSSTYGECDFEMSLYLPNDLVAVDNYPEIKYPLVQFYTQKNIPSKVNVRTHSYQLRADSPEEDSIKVHLHTIDFNADNVADMAVTQGAIPAYVSETKIWVAYFVNLNGEWYFAFNFVEPECT